MEAVAHTKQDIVERLLRSQSAIKTLGVKRLGLFGSFVRGDQDADSDVDLLVEFEPEKKTFDNFTKLSFLLEDALQRQVELVTTEALSPYIGPHILEEVEFVPFSC
jgi:uncharacterized protein